MPSEEGIQMVSVMVSRKFGDAMGCSVFADEPFRNLQCMGAGRWR